MYIKLHSKKDNTPFVFSADTITHIYHGHDNDGRPCYVVKTIANASRLKEIYIVTETAERMLALHGAMFMPLHGTSDNMLMLVNKSHVTFVDADKGKSSVYLSDGTAVNVHESVDRIYTLLTKI